MKPGFFCSVIACCLWMASVFAQEPSSVIPLVAVDGVFDMGTMNSQEESVPLNGNWGFHWKQMLSPTAFDSSVSIPPSGFLTLPSYWKHQKVGEVSVSNRGYGTYRLLVKNVPEGFTELYVPEMCSSYRLWVNQQLVAVNGIPGVTKETTEPSYLPQVVRIPQSKTLEMVLQVANFHHHRGGVGKPLTLGTRARVLGDYQKKVATDFFLFGSLFIIALYHIGFYWVRRKERILLYFGLYCLAYGLRTMYYNGYFNEALHPFINWEWERRFEYWLLFLSVFFLLLFIEKLYPKEVIHWFLKSLKIFMISLCAVVLVTPPTIFSQLVPQFSIAVLLAGIHFFYVIVRAIKNRQEGAWIVLIGGGVLVGTAINDVLYYNKWIYTGELGAVGTFSFIFSQSFLLSRKFANAFFAVETLSERLLALDKLRDEFLANTSHELRTPLSGIVGISESLLDGAAGSVTIEQRENLQLISQSGRRLSRLIDDILDFSKIKNHNLVLQVGSVDLHSATDIAVRLSQSLIGEKNIELINQTPSQLPMLIGDENRIQQILLNLIGNAIKFTHQGRVVIDAQREDDWLCVTVSDTGIGVAPEQQERIFEAFEQADGSTTRAYGGTGLGLSITKQLVELHQGTITLQSVVGQGSTFYVRFPLDPKFQPSPSFTESKEPESFRETAQQAILRKPVTSGVIEPSGEELQSTAAVVGNGEQQLILVVDDEPINLQVLKNLLTLRHYQVITAQDAFHALEILETQQPHVMIVDVMMPRMSGYELCQRVRKTRSPSELPIILLSAKNQIQDLVEGLKSGANDYLTKPFYKEELLVRVQMQMQLKDSLYAVKQGERQAMELQTAKLVQSLLIPKEDPKLEEFEISSFYRSASETGGDWYGFLYRPDKRALDVLIGDVTGHGVPAAIITAMVNSFYQSTEAHRLQMTKEGQSFHQLLSPAYLLERLNNILYHSTNGLYNMTFFYSVFDLETKILTYVSAGHNPCYVWRSGKFQIQKGERMIEQSLVNLNTGGNVLGYASGSQYEIKTQQLQSGDVVIWYTDGLVENESESHEMFGVRRLRHLLSNLEGFSVEKIRDHIIDSAYQHYGNMPPDDDVALIVGRVK